MALRLGTRGSALARAQTELAAAALLASGLDKPEVVVLETTGDRLQATAIADMPGQGWFTTELEAALAGGRVDVAVHSAKDLPSELAPGLEIAALLARGDVRDCLVTADGRGLASLAAGSRLGTSSPRRVAQMAAARPDLVCIPVRGNVDTRLAKLQAGEFDGLVLAAAGMDRLGLGERIAERLDFELFVPAPAQGAIALQVRAGGAEGRAVAGAGDAGTAACLAAERTVLVELGGGCLIPLGAYARIEDGRMFVTGAMPHDGGMRVERVEGAPAEATALGRRLAQLLR
jgi:hydroxymethylbilane synthase